MYKMRDRKYYLRYLKSRTNRVDNLQQAITKLLTAMGGDPQKAKFSKLWQSWSNILGEDLASMAYPLGTENKYLLVGVEDALTMQEVQFQKDEIKQKVNDWLGNEYFEDVRLSLMLGREAKGEIKPSANDQEIVTIHQSEPKNVLRGTFLKDMDPDSAVAKAYAKYVKKRVP